MRTLFRELAAGMVDRLSVLFPGSEDDTGAYFLHALSVGLAIVDLATNRPKGQKRAAALLEHALAYSKAGDVQ